jgi:ATP-dependent Lon protease
MTGFGNARLAHSDAIRIDDLPSANARRSKIGFTH